MVLKFTILELIDSTSCECLAVALARRHNTSFESLARCAELGDMNSCESLAVALARRHDVLDGLEIHNYLSMNSTSCECLARCAELGDMNSCESLAVALARRHDVLDELDEAADVHDDADVHVGLEITSCDRALRYLETRCLNGCLIDCLLKQLLR